MLWTCTSVFLLRYSVERIQYRQVIANHLIHHEQHKGCCTEEPTLQEVALEELKENAAQVIIALQSPWLLRTSEIVAD